MSAPPKGVTFIVHRDGDPDSRTFRVPFWTLRLLTGIGLGLGAVLLLGLALYLPIVRTAARVPGLTRDIDRLEAENAKIRQLVAALDSAEQRYAQIRQMLGADIVPDPVALASKLPIAPAIRARIPDAAAHFEDGPSAPSHWPTDEPGYVTRGQSGAGGREEEHPGIDIAVPIGTMIRASGGGEVLQTGTDPEYGLFVLLQHPDGYQTMYGHLSRVAVGLSQPVGSGEVIGLSGNSGRSSAPHLHFEIRREGKSLDPLTLVKEGS